MKKFLIRIIEFDITIGLITQEWFCRFCNGILKITTWWIDKEENLINKLDH